jgi:hypothetical protein
VKLPERGVKLAVEAVKLAVEDWCSWCEAGLMPGIE